MVKVWILLFILSVIYSLLVYFRSDASNVQSGSEAMEGQLIWQKSNCQACHQIYGLGGYLGPDLTNVSAKGDEYIRAFLASGTTRMPDFHFNEEETIRLLAFLEWVNRTGHAQVKPESVHWTGSFRGIGKDE
jgi:nitric oxide reductase subunit C